MKTTSIFSILIAWLPFAAIITILSGTIYVTVQQSYRMMANDPQIQMSEDISQALLAGKDPIEVISGGQVAIEKSLAPYVVIYDTQQNVVAGNGYLHGALPQLPKGVLDEAQKRGEYTVTWQPEPGVRQALAVTAYTNGYVVSGRSLSQTEDRIGKLTALVGFGWIASLLASLILVAFARFLGA